jgi:pimeloyl-ACP methyl ester carboxylesterase
MMRRVAVSILVLAACLTQAASSFAADPVVEMGELDGVPYRIQVPVDWNGGLVMYAHGYRPRGGSWAPLPPVFAAVFLSRGFAVAESGYSRQGWALEEAVAQTEAVRLFFAEKHGAPDSTFVTGHSMGGIIALATIETYPGAYDGAMPLCGPLAPAYLFFEDVAFDMLVTFEALFGDYLPPENRPVIETDGMSAQIVEQALAADSTLAEQFATHWTMRRGDLASTVSFYQLFYRELADRAGGNPVGNRGTIYCGFGDNRDLNRSAPRYDADPAAFEYARRYYTPTGRISDPVLAVHTTYDPGVPPSLPSFYETLTTLEGTGGLFVQLHVEADGHCNIPPALVGKAFDMLRGWAGGGVRPGPGLLE